MKSNECKMGRDGAGIDDILTEVEKSADYNGLNDKQSLRLRLLAEELVKMLPELVEYFTRSFWVESGGRNTSFTRC